MRANFQWTSICRILRFCRWTVASLPAMDYGCWIAMEWENIKNADGSALLPRVCSFTEWYRLTHKEATQDRMKQPAKHCTLVDQSREPDEGTWNSDGRIYFWSVKTRCGRKKKILPMKTHNYAKEHENIPHCLHHSPSLDPHSELGLKNAVCCQTSWRVEILKRIGKQWE